MKILLRLLCLFVICVFLFLFGKTLCFLFWTSTDLRNEGHGRGRHVLCVPWGCSRAPTCFPLPWEPRLPSTFVSVSISFPFLSPCLSYKTLSWYNQGPQEDPRTWPHDLSPNPLSPHLNDQHVRICGWSTSWSFCSLEIEPVGTWSGNTFLWHFAMKQESHFFLHERVCVCPRPKHMSQVCRLTVFLPLLIWVQCCSSRQASRPLAMVEIAFPRRKFLLE